MAGVGSQGRKEKIRTHSKLWRILLGGSAYVRNVYVKYLRHYFLGEGELADNLVFGFIARRQGLRPEASHVVSHQ